MKSILTFTIFLISNISYSQNIDQDLLDELKLMVSKDQAVRMDFDSIVTNYGYNSKQFTSLVDRMKVVDSVNVERLKEIVDEYGWPGRSLVGANGNHSAWLILQHADSLTQEEYLPLLKESVDKYESNFTDYAYLLDRVLMRRGEPQIYGTQITINENGEYELYEVAEEEKLNERRKAASMESIEEYLKNFNIEYNKPND